MWKKTGTLNAAGYSPDPLRSFTKKTGFQVTLWWRSESVRFRFCKPQSFENYELRTKIFVDDLGSFNWEAIDRQTEDPGSISGPATRSAEYFSPYSLNISPYQRTSCYMLCQSLSLEKHRERDSSWKKTRGGKNFSSPRLRILDRLRFIAWRNSCRNFYWATSKLIA